MQLDDLIGRLAILDAAYIYLSMCAAPAKVTRQAQLVFTVGKA